MSKFNILTFQSQTFEFDFFQSPRGTSPMMGMGSGPRAAIPQVNLIIMMIVIMMMVMIIMVKMVMTTGRRMPALWYGMVVDSPNLGFPCTLTF